MDTSHNVRTHANEALGHLVLRVKRGLAPQLRTLIGPWWMSQHDVYKEAAQAAQAAFEVGCPGSIFLTTLPHAFFPWRKGIIQQGAFY